MEETLAAETPSIAQQILDRADVQIARIRVPEWDLSVRVRGWTAGERADFDSETLFLEEVLGEAEGGALVGARAVAWSIVNEDGSRAFATPRLETLRRLHADGKSIEAAIKVYRQLTEKSSRGLGRVVRVVNDLNGLSDDSEIVIEKN